MTVLSLWEMSLAGAVLILAAVLIRAAAGDRLPRETYLALWGLALARLLIPLSLPSPVSAYNLAPRSAPASPLTAALPAAQASVPSAVDAAARTGGAASWLTWLWLAGAAACALAFFTVWLRCRREFAMSLPAEDGFALGLLADQKLRRTVRLRQSDRIGSPLTYGLLRPVILMPGATDWSDRAALTCVLTHELVHIRRLDAAWKLLLTAAACVHWFNPLAWVMLTAANRDLELTCDRQVLRRLGADQRGTYAEALIKFAQRRSGPSPFCSGFGMDPTEERISAIMKHKKTSLTSLLLALLVVAGTAALLSTSALAEGGAHHGWRHDSACPAEDCPTADCPDDSCPQDDCQDEGVCLTAGDQPCGPVVQPADGPAYPVQPSLHHSETHHTESHSGHHGDHHG